MKRFDMTEYTVTSAKFPEGFSGFTFAMLSDLHSNVYHIDLNLLMTRIQEAKPDAILIGGDMINSARRDNPLEVTGFIKSLASQFPTFYALGNHEYRLIRRNEEFGYRFEAYRAYLEEAGVCFLCDETVTLEKDEVQIALTGVCLDHVFYYRNPPEMGPGLMAHHIGNCDPTKFNLLLAHHPNYFYQYAQWGADLTLSGHVHGGIIRMGKRGLIATSGSLFPYFDEGMYMSPEGGCMIVSRGLGTHTIKVRINNRPELVIVKLGPEPKEE